MNDGNSRFRADDVSRVEMAPLNRWRVPLVGVGEVAELGET